MIDEERGLSGQVHNLKAKQVAEQDANNTVGVVDTLRERRAATKNT